MILSEEFVVNIANDNRSLISITTDPSSERLMLFDRKYGVLMWHCRTDGGQLIHRILPLRYATGDLLLCVLVDDNAEFNAAAMDGVACEQIDSAVFDINAIV